MKVVIFSVRSAVVATLVCVAMIVFGIFFVFGGDKEEISVAPEIEIVLPEGADE